MVDPLNYFSFQLVLHSWCNKGRGMYYPVCGMVHIKEPLLLIGKNSTYIKQMEGRKEMCFFNDAFNTFYLQVCDVGHMVKYHSDGERGNPLPPSHGLIYPIGKTRRLYMHHPTYGIVHTTTFVTPVVEHWLDRVTAQL